MADGVSGLLHNIDVPLVGVIDTVFVVCQKHGIFVKWCPKIYNRITYNVSNFVRSRISLQVSYDTPFCKLNTLLSYLVLSLG